MKGRIALITGAAAVLAASSLLGSGALRASDPKGGDQDQKIEKRVVVRHGGGRLGVSIGDPEGEARGALVRSVEEDSAAAKAGLKEGDVVVRFDGEAVRSASQLRRLVAETPAGRAVAIEVTRGGTTQKLTATLNEGGREIRIFRGDGGEFALDVPDWEADVPEPPLPPHPPIAPHAPRAPHAWSFKGDDGAFAFHMLGPSPRKLGVQFMEIGEQLAGYFKLSAKSGVLVTAVDADGPAAKAGIKAGDVILKVGSDAVADGDDLREALSEAEGGSEVTITVQRDGRPLDLKATLAKPEERRKRREARGVSL